MYTYLVIFTQIRSLSIRKSASLEKHFCSVQIISRLNSQSKLQMFTLFTGRHVGGLKRSSNMAAPYYTVGSVILCGTFGRMNAHTLNLDNCLLYLLFTISQVFDFIQCTVFDFIFYCVTLHTLYRIEVTKISSGDCEVHNLYVNTKVSFAGSLRNVNQILVVSSLLHSRTDCLSIYIIFTNCRKFSLICVQYDIEISQFRLSSSNILLSDRERIIFSLFVMNNCRFYSTGSQSNAILRRQQNLYWLVSWLTNTKYSEDDHFQTGTNGKQWRSVIAGTNHFFENNGC